MRRRELSRRNCREVHSDPGFRWADRIGAWAAGGEPTDAIKFSALPPRKRAARDVYCYFDNDAKVHAPFDAQALRTEVDAESESRRARASRSHVRS
jgi:uncharacterized protein YecE (DUF72 family)